MLARRAILMCALCPAMSRAQICDGAVKPLAPSRDLYCIELIAAPGIEGASGRVELGRRPGPFTIDVTAGGDLRYAPTISLAGLPASASLGSFSTYIAWVATPLMYPVTRLGVVANGRAVLPSIALDKFVVLVTAESSPDAREPTGRIVLRGASPSTRLQPPDLIQFAIGATRDSIDAHAHHQMGVPVPQGAVVWTGVPMPPGLSMLPAEMLLRPRVAPYLPRPSLGAPLARPRQLMRFAAADTVRLTAGIVRRNFKGRTVTMFGFNEQYPGPLLLVPQNANLTVELTNALDQPTTIHWHGVRLENANDGVPDITQPAVQPGQRFVYHVHFPDAGIYWYHPHVREDVQQDLGLYGNMLVRSPRGDYYGLAHREEVLMLDDLLLDDNG